MSSTSLVNTVQLRNLYPRSDLSSKEKVGEQKEKFIVTYNNFLRQHSNIYTRKTTNLEMECFATTEENSKARFNTKRQQRTGELWVF